MLRLVMTEAICDGVLSALASVSEIQVAEQARLAFQHVRSTSDLRRLMIQGLDLKGVNDQGWREISSETGAASAQFGRRVVAGDAAVLVTQQDQIVHSMHRVACLVFAMLFSLALTNGRKL